MPKPEYNDDVFQPFTENELDELADNITLLIKYTNQTRARVDNYVLSAARQIIWDLRLEEMQERFNKERAARNNG